MFVTISPEGGVLASCDNHVYMPGCLIGKSVITNIRLYAPVVVLIINYILAFKSQNNFSCSFFYFTSLGLVYFFSQQYSELFDLFKT